MRVLILASGGKDSSLASWWAMCRGWEVVALVKPQFEVGKGRVGKGGVVRDPALHAEVLAQLQRRADVWQVEVKGVIESSLRGAKGNREFLLYLQKR